MMIWDRRLAILEAIVEKRRKELEAKGILTPTQSQPPPAICVQDPKPETVDGK